MQVDPSQPIIFDSDAFPGRGAGYWQADPFGASRDDEPRSTKARTPLEHWVQVGTVVSILTFIAIGGVASFW